MVPLATLDPEQPAQVAITHRDIDVADTTVVIDTIRGNDHWVIVAMAVGDVITLLGFDEQVQSSAAANSDDPVGFFATQAAQKISESIQ